MTSALRMSRQATEPPQPPTNKTDIFIDTDGDLAYKRPDGSVGKLKGGGTANLAGYNLTLGADVLLAGSVAGGGTVSVPTGHTAAFARGGTPMVRGSNHAAGRVPVFSTNTDVLDGDAGLSYDAANDLLSVGTGVVGAQMRLVEQGSSPAQVSGHTVVFVDTNGDLCWRKDDGSVVKLAAAGSYTLTIPATGTAALLGTANTFTAAQTFGSEIKSSAGTPLQLRPGSNATNAVQIQNAGGTAVMTIDTVNSSGAIKNLSVGGRVVRAQSMYYPIGAPRVLNLVSTDADLKGFHGGFTDGRYGYFVPNNNGVRFGKVARVDLSDFSTVSVLNLASTDADLKGFVGGFTDGRYGYFVPNNNGVRFGKVARIQMLTGGNL